MQQAAFEIRIQNPGRLKSTKIYNNLMKLYSVLYNDNVIITYKYEEKVDSFWCKILVSCIGINLKSNPLNKVLDN